MTSGNQTISGTKTFNSAIVGNVTGNLTGNASTVTNGIYTTSSVADLSDVSSAGSGAIITSAERTLLSTLDNTTLKLTGSQTVTGTKTFNDVTINELSVSKILVGANQLFSNGSTIESVYAPLASPALTGTPTAPTATAGTNTTQLATTEFVQTAVANGGGGGGSGTTNTIGVNMEYKIIDTMHTYNLR